MASASIHWPRTVDTSGWCPCANARRRSVDRFRLTARRAVARALPPKYPTKRGLVAGDRAPQLRRSKRFVEHEVHAKSFALDVRQLLDSASGQNEPHSG